MPFPATRAESVTPTSHRTSDRPLVEQVMTAEPYARAQRVFWIVDNGSSHRGQV